MPTLFKVKRSKERKIFPLIEYFYYTGESINPWRCECCLKKQHRKKEKEFKLVNSYDSELPKSPDCCRKCGLSFYS